MERQHYIDRKFVFTDKECRELQFDDRVKNTTYTDSLCRCLRIMVSKYGNHSYMYQKFKGSKVIGNVFAVTVKEAREIVKNIEENYDEYIQVAPTIKMPLSAYFKKYGAFPHKEVEEVHSDSYEARIESMQQDIDILTKQIKVLNDENDILTQKLINIREIVNYTD